MSAWPGSPATTSRTLGFSSRNTSRAGGISRYRFSLGERDCSAQRRNQKIVEETPAPNLPDATRAALWETACRLGETVSYESAGTVEYLYDAATGAFYFLEVNTRLQVEHGVTEEVNGVDLVEWMVRQAAGEMPPLDQASIKPRGASIQVRLYAEDPGRDFRPSSGLLTHVAWPKDTRIETWVESGSEVSPFYDPMLAKIIATGETRDEALAKLQAALDATEIGGLETNLGYLRQLSRLDTLARGEMLTRTLQSFAYKADTIEVLIPGTQTTIQDWPGRVGYWAVGVPPSGPMDPLSFRFANRLVGNDEGAAAIETTLSGPTLKFNSDTVICLGGAELAATLDGEPMPYWQAFAVKAGQVLKVGGVKGPGARAISRFKAASTCRVTSAAARPSRSASSAATQDGRSAPATCCISALRQRAHRRRPPCRPS
jgi:urea carboxylase